MDGNCPSVSPLRAGDLAIALPPIRKLIKRRWPASPQAAAVLGVLETSYAKTRKWWESVGLVRRLALLSVATFVVNPLWRALGLFILCFIVLPLHLFFKPYADTRYGRMETSFLCILTVIAALGIPSSVYAYLGTQFQGNTADAHPAASALLRCARGCATKEAVPLSMEPDSRLDRIEQEDCSGETILRGDSR